MPTESTISEGHMGHGVNRKSCTDPAQSETLCMLGSNLRRSWEISAVTSATRLGGTEKVKDRKSVIDAVEKSDTSSRSALRADKAPRSTKPGE